MMIPPLTLEILGEPHPFDFAGLSFQIERLTVADWVISRVTADGTTPVGLIDGHTDESGWLVTGVDEIIPVQWFARWDDAWQRAVAMPMP